MLVLPIRLARRPLATSHLALALAIVAFERGLVLFAVMDLLVFCASINYWRWPARGVRRNLDIAVTLAAVAVHLFLHLLNRVTLLLYAVSVLLYGAARREPDPEFSSRWHSLMHVSAFGANLHHYHNLNETE